MFRISFSDMNENEKIQINYLIYRKYIHIPNYECDLLNYNLFIIDMCGSIERIHQLNDFLQIKCQTIRSAVQRIE